MPEETGNSWGSWTTKALQLTPDKTGRDAGETIKASWMSSRICSASMSKQLQTMGQVWAPGFRKRGRQGICNHLSGILGANE